MKNDDFAARLAHDLAKARKHTPPVSVYMCLACLSEMTEGCMRPLCYPVEGWEYEKGPKDNIDC